MTSEILRIAAEVATIGVAFFWLGIEWQKRSHLRRRTNRWERMISNDARLIARAQREKERASQ